MEPIDQLHEWTTLYLEWLDNEISKLKKTVALYEGGTYNGRTGIEFGTGRPDLPMRLQERLPHYKA